MWIVEQCLHADEGFFTFGWKKKPRVKEKHIQIGKQNERKIRVSRDKPGKLSQQLKSPGSLQSMSPEYIIMMK